jgi:hypothetical protein
MANGQDFCDVKQWQICEAVDDTITLRGRSMAVLISDND